MFKVYEFMTFSFPITCGATYDRDREDALTDAQIRQTEWRQHGGEIRAALQLWLDQRWEPLAQVGASCIRLRVEKKQAIAVNDVLYGMMTSPFASASLQLLALPMTVAAPVEFRLRLRRLC